MGNKELNKNSQEFAIDRLLAEFHQSVDAMALDPDKYKEMLIALKIYNPDFEPVYFGNVSKKVNVLANVVAGIYAPLMHAYTSCILKNIQLENLSSVVMTPPRDALPLANSLIGQANIKGIGLQILYPHVNRNTAGIVNNQKKDFSGKSPYLDLLFDQINKKINGSKSLVELETGIYGTTSLVTAEALKKRGLLKYYPIKFYGLGPNFSFVHAVLSNGEEWIAEKSEAKGLVETTKITELMVLLDTMEELGMERMYQSVEKLQIGEDGEVEPVIVPVSQEELDIATTTNNVIKQTAFKYAAMSLSQTRKLLDGTSLLVQYSKEGFPFTLKEAIPSMDSKDVHFANIRESKLFDYPDLEI